MNGGLPGGYRRLIREHVYDKCWALDVTWAEIEAMLESSVAVETHELARHRTKEIRLLRGSGKPLHVVCVVDNEQRIIVFITVYEPDLDHWRPGFEGAEALMQCVMCDGVTVATTRPKAVERDGRVAVIRDVPVEVCESCGEVYLDSAVARRLDELFREMLRGNVDEVFGHYVSTAA